MTAGFEPTFENGGFWEYYKDLERQFEDYLKYVPYLEGNAETYSFRLANLIVSIGAHVDSALKEIAKHPMFEKYPDMINPKDNHGKSRKQNILDFYPVAEELKLTDKIVSFKCLPKKENLKPYESYIRTSSHVPEWWTSYNKIKHNFKENFKEAKLITVRNALAGAFLLNVLHKSARQLLWNNWLLNPKYSRGSLFLK